MTRSQRQFVLALFIATFVLISVFLYANIDSTRSQDPLIKQSIDVENLRREVEHLNGQLKHNKEAMEKIKADLVREEEEFKKKKDLVHENAVYDEKNDAAKEQEIKLDNLKGKPDDVADFEEKEDIIEKGGNKVAVVHQVLEGKKTAEAVTNVCKRRNLFSKTDADVQMLDVYNTLKFDNLDGGVWKQGWPITYDEKQAAAGPPLQVIVIPHSHCDPGWIKTFEQYYEDQTSQILSGMAKHLGEKEDMRFIYAEMSFFEMWWKQQDEQTRQKVKGYLDSGKFEIVTGGWVMTDEANAHYFSIITELFEGHEWLMNHLDYRPTSHWSIDPFGLSPSLPLLLSASNITNAALQRIHYSVKKYLAKNKKLEFMWRQLWGEQGQKDVKAHVFPFYSYDIPHTCGPEPAVCCQFDFKRLPGAGDSCPWNVPPQEINEGNVAARAFKLYDQYRKKSQLYDTNALLIPLGDDFRYAGDFEWNVQHTNYKKLFDYMNTQKDWNVQAKFGTLSDYFKVLESELKKNNKKLPIFTGDFFTYADRDDHYWSGYFTSRPFYKQMDRVLAHYLRSAEIAFSLASMNGFKNDTEFSSLVVARRAHSLFQHHDGVTGTAKDHVVVDYGSKMLAALNACESVLAASLQHLLDSKDLGLKMSEDRPSQDVLPEKKVFSAGSNVVIFNTLSRPRTDPICCTVSSPNIRVKKTVEQQISPLFELKDGRLVTSQGKYELCFIHRVNPFSIETFELVEEETAMRASVFSNAEIINRDFEVSSLTESIILDNDLISAKFNERTGMLKSVRPSGKVETEINLHFINYGARGHKQLNSGGGDDLSGAYLFLPDGPANVLPKGNHHVVFINGPIVKHVVVAGHKEVHILQRYTLAKGSYDLGIETEADIKETSNYELAIRMDTSVKSGENLYTDLNGMQMIRRVRMLNKLPLQAHYYPMPGSAFIEDNIVRVNMLGAQALGVASLKEGQLEIMLDRRLNQDDGRGLFQGVLDNKRTLSRFRLLVEPISEPNEVTDARVGFLSTVAHSSSLEVHYPYVQMVTQSPLASKAVKGITSSLPCDFHVVSLRMLANPTDYVNNPEVARARNEAVLILHRTLPDCRSEYALKNECSSASDSVAVKELLPKVLKATGGSLTMMYEDTVSQGTIAVEPQQVRSIKLHW